MIKKSAIGAFLLVGAFVVPTIWLHVSNNAVAQRPSPRVQAIEPRDAWELVPAIEAGLTTHTVRSYRFLADEEKTTFTLQVISRSFRRVKLDDKGTTVFVRQLRRDLEMNPETGEITRRVETR